MNEYQKRTESQGINNGSLKVAFKSTTPGKPNLEKDNFKESSRFLTEKR